jgi:hypothetical protein
MINNKDYNDTILGFTSLNDFAQTLLGWKAKYFVGVVSLLGAFISKFVYQSAPAIYFLVFLLAVDVLTALIRAIKTKSFTSKRLGRVLPVLLTYMVVLACSFNMAKYSALYSWLPGVIYSGFLAIVFSSICENLILLGWLPADLYNNIKERINIKNLFKKKKPEE